MRRRWFLTSTWLLLSAAGQAMADVGPSSRDTSRLEEGESIYRQYCASCHGLEGEGMPNWERQNAQGELPAPPHGPEGHTWKHSDAMLYRIVAEGWRDPWNKTERLTMPAFKDILSPDEIRAVVNYLKTLWTPEQRRHQAVESEGAPFPEQGEP
ncbi:cytochrome c [Billgrantia azerbaijanica]|nr:cytochrome c [Halomonas azerbaijanica]